MEKILNKLEDLVVRALDKIEEKPIRSLIVIVILYYIFRIMYKRVK